MMQFLIIDFPLEIVIIISSIYFARTIHQVDNVRRIMQLNTTACSISILTAKN